MTSIKPLLKIEIKYGPSQGGHGERQNVNIT
jgi:hypothetical protein